MKEKVTARNLWRGIYPILFFQGTAIVIQNILMITLSVMSANSKYTGISQYSDRVNKINLHAMEITLLTDIICIIIMAYFMYSDIVKDKLKGIYVKYDKVKWTKYLLVIPFAYFFMMSANALVSILTLYMPENMVGTYDNTKEIIAFMHYPPLVKQQLLENNHLEFYKVLKKYDIKRCYYGHLHGNSIHDAIEGKIQGIELKLVSADGLDFKLIKI